MLRNRATIEPRLLAGAFAAVACLGAAGCATSLKQYVHNGFKVGPNYQRPAVAVADDWIDSRDPRVEIGEEDYAAWWTVFGDSVLDGLIDTAYAQNLTLREAGFRVLEVRAQRGIAVGNYFPQSQQVFGDYTRTMRSLQLGGIPPGFPLTSLGPRFLSNWRLGGQLAWELDFWGRFRRSIEAADAQLDASIENYDDALVLLLAEVASTYVDIRTFEQQIDYARQNAALQRESARVADARLRAMEKDSELDAPQAKSSLAQTEAIIEEFEISLRQAKNRLAVLLGRPPQDMADLLGGPAPIPVAPQTVVLGLPAELLLRRPDVRRAEREAAAQSAEIGVAESELYPQISVNGSLSLESSRFDKLFDRFAGAGSIGPEFRWNVLNYGRLLNNIRVQDARFQQLVARYQQTVLNANEEAENALVAFLRYHEEVNLLQFGERQAREAVRVATAKYEAGAVDYNRLFTVQQFLVGQQDQLAAARGNLATSLIQLYRALGGGWQIRLSGPSLGELDGRRLPEVIPRPMPAEIDDGPPAPNHGNGAQVDGILDGRAGMSQVTMQQPVRDR